MKVRFDSEQGLVVVLAELTGPTGFAALRLALDTGATSSLVNVAPLVALGYDPALASDRTQVTTGSGVEYVPRIVLQRIRVLGSDREDFPVLAHTLPPSASVDGLLGLDFMRGRILTVNFRSGYLDLA